MLWVPKPWTYHLSPTTPENDQITRQTKAIRTLIEVDRGCSQALHTAHRKVMAPLQSAIVGFKVVSRSWSSLAFNTPLGKQEKRELHVHREIAVLTCSPTWPSPWEVSLKLLTSGGTKLCSSLAGILFDNPQPPAMDKYMHAYINICIYIYICTYTYAECLHTYLYTYMFVYIYICNIILQGVLTMAQIIPSLRAAQEVELPAVTSADLPTSSLQVGRAANATTHALSLSLTYMYIYLYIYILAQSIDLSIYLSIYPSIY